MVVSVGTKAADMIRGQVGIRKMSASKPFDDASLELFNTIKTEGVWISRDKFVGSLMTGRTVDGV
jgi:hypothetical protein